MIRLQGDEMERLIQALGGEPGKHGRTRCFLHGGKNPTSFSYSPEGLWYCFAEGRGGDAVQLVMEARGCTYKEALEFMAELGIIEAELALKDRRKRREIRKELKERQELRERVLFHAKGVWKAVERAARAHLDELDMDLYLEVSRHYEALKRRAWAADRETALRFVRMRGAARALLRGLSLTPQEKRFARTVFRWPDVPELIYRLSSRTVEPKQNSTRAEAAS